MQFELVTLFPEMFASFLSASILGKAQDKGAFTVHYTDPRTFTHDKHRSVDDTPYGGGAGMVMRPGPLVEALASLEAARGPAHKILLCPSGAPLTQATVNRLAQLPRLALVCGRYEGFDERVRDFVDEELSLGDFVLSGGEPAAMCLLDAVARRLPGVLGNLASTEEESHEGGLLEYPQYTRPPVFQAGARALAVPEVLLGGNHEQIRRWRRKEALRRTRARRPELLARLALGDEDRVLLAELAAEPGDAGPPAPRLVDPRRSWVALVHHPVYDRTGKVVSTALTNLDLHDIARAARTYDLAGYIIVHPVEAQRELAKRIAGHWMTEGATLNDYRRQAIERVHVVATLEEARDLVQRRAGGQAPLLLATSARRAPDTIDAEDLGPVVGDAPLLVVLGTGWGLADEALALCQRRLSPVEPRPRPARSATGTPAYNHLSVRSACAIILDRLYGDRKSFPPSDPGPVGPSK